MLPTREAVDSYRKHASLEGRNSTPANHLGNEVLYSPMRRRPTHSTRRPLAAEADPSHEEQTPARSISDNLCCGVRLSIERIVGRIESRLCGSRDCHKSL